MTQLKAMIVGHSVCARLQSDLIAGSDPWMECSFKLAGKVDETEFLGRGGNALSAWKKKTQNKFAMKAQISLSL